MGYHFYGYDTYVLCLFCEETLLSSTGFEKVSGHVGKDHTTGKWEQMPTNKQQETETFPLPSETVHKELSSTK